MPKGGKGRGSGGGKSTRAVASARAARVRVESARGRTLSSTRWLDRQLNDPYVIEARRLGYRGRAAFKLAEIDDRHRILKPGARIVDLGCAPGGWTQIALERCGEGARVVGIDLLECAPIPGATLLIGDFTEDDAPGRLRAAMGGPADAVLCDMTANATGHPQTDHLRIVVLVEMAYDFARDVLVSGGSFVAKVFSGGTEAGLLAVLRRDFERVFHMKPPASRKQSPEMYVVALGFHAAAEKTGESPR